MIVGRDAVLGGMFYKTGARNMIERISSTTASDPNSNDKSESADQD
jgi:hypothetical protein